MEKPPRLARARSFDEVRGHVGARRRPGGQQQVELQLQAVVMERAEDRRLELVVVEALDEAALTGEEVDEVRRIRRIAELNSHRAGPPVVIVSGREPK